MKDRLSRATDLQKSRKQRNQAVASAAIVAPLVAILLAAGAAALNGCSQKPTVAAASSDSTGISEAQSKATSAATIPDTGPLPRLNGTAAMQYVRRVVAFGPRWVGSSGHARTENFLRTELKGDSVEEDSFTAQTPAGPKAMRNFIAKYPGTKDGIVVVAGHYDTLYNRPDFIGANDAGSSTGLLLQLAKDLRAELKSGERQGYSVWVVWFDGEEAINKWSETDSVYGSRHLAEKWQGDGTLKRIRAFLLVDMVGDADLNIERDANSTPWLEDMIQQAAIRYGYQSHFFARDSGMEDDHVPFKKRDVPVADLIDFDYGYDNAFWHTKEDTVDKLSPKSLEIVGSVVEQTIRMLDQK
jgi:Zn-dependent M28 family amino/carboxypeptidase